MLKEFLERVREWGGGRDAATQELVRSLVLGSLPSDGTTADGVPCRARCAPPRSTGLATNRGSRC